ncbi:uncharacterized protein B0T15DRAFT_489381 [Chaetomium strumarium]|uniref:Uncharacterized protein n=1 Tax=Chaetomium strumarium TaxID=1170767 RepID=A0AAJ0H2M4_9PEZI|nr:hypothetical protein B0T15DRAFT_489381 [Chaetomium strumarium]
MTTIAMEGYLSAPGSTIVWRNGKVKKDIVSAQLKWLKAALDRKGNSVSATDRHPLVARTKAGQLPRQTWEPSPSFYTFAEIYFAAEYFGIQSLKSSMVKSVEDLTRHVLSLSEGDGSSSACFHCAHCPYYRGDEDEEADDAELEREAHLASFLDAVVCVEKHKWSAKIQKAVYDAGDRMKHRLVKLPAWREFVEKYPGGKNFARAIGVRL